MRWRQGFTLIELLVVIAILGVLLAVAAPRYMTHLEVARETALRQDLRAMREAIDQFHADQGRYPQQLDELVMRRYLRAIPEDPVTGRTDSWAVVAPAPGVAGAVFDVRSGSAALSRDGSPYAAW